MTVKAYLPNRRADLADACGEFVRGEFRLGTGALNSTLFGAGKRYPGEREWVHTWAGLGELLLPLARAARGWDRLSSFEAAVLKTESLQFAGGSRECREWLDEYVISAPDAEEVGRRVLDSVVGAATKAIDAAREDDSAIALTIGRDLTLEERAAADQLFLDFAQGVVAPVAKLVGIETRLGKSVELTADQAKRTWLGIGRRIPLEPMPAIIYLSQTIGREVFPDAPQTVVQPGEDFFAALNDPRTGLPPLLAAKFSAGESLMAHKAFVEQEADYFDSGIEPPGTTELDRRGFRYLFGEGGNQSVVVLAPTSAGKSRFGQLALIRSVFQQKRQRNAAFGRVVVLAPTKALVDQVSREIRQTLKGTEAAGWNVLEGSRDYPQNDEAIRTCRFDIAVIIPEKLAALVRSGMQTDRIPLILVDELQHIVDGQRGLKLESLLLDVFNRERVPRFIGLSASLEPETVSLLKRWFAKNELSVDFLEIGSRPVPLTVSIVDDHRRIVSRTHIRDDRSTTQRRLPDIPLALGKGPIRQTSQEFRRTLALLMEILGPHVSDGRIKDDAPSLLIFVRSKKIAENLADACRELLVRHLGLAPADLNVIDDPQPNYRFVAFAPAGTNDRNHSEVDPTTTLRLLAPTPLRNQLAETLSSGVGFHSASLTAVGREIVEDLFRRGVVRILFATDTLRLGINLPADIVVNGDLVVYAGESGPRLVDKDVLLQRLGRAGRLLRSRGLGIGYLVTPEFIDDSAQNQIDDRASKLFTGRPDSGWEQIKEAVKSQDALYKAFVADWSGGAHHFPPTGNEWFEDLLLQHFEHLPTRSLPRAALASESADLFSRTLAGVAGVSEPKGAAEALEEIGAITSVAGSLRLTDAGRATAMNALGVGDLPVIQQVASEALGGAGPLSLLYLACKSDFVTSAHQELRVRPRASVDVLEGMLQQLSKVRSASASTERQRRDQFMRNFALDIPDCFGRGAAADELVELLQVDSAVEATEEELTALWRAFNVYMRWIGASYSSISKLPNPSHTQIPEVALDRLSANVAYFIAAASDLLGSNPTTMHFRTLSYFAREVELGVPATLAPLLHLNRPSIDRERVLGISPLLTRDGLRWDGLAELFRAYLEEDQGIPRSKEGWHPLPGEETEQVLRELEALDRRRSSAAYSVAASVESMVVPGLDGQRVGEVLRQIPQGNGPRLVAAMLESFGLHPTIDMGRRAVLVELAAPDGTFQRTYFHFPDRTVDNDILDAVASSLSEHENALVVAIEGATFGAITRGRFLQDSCTIIDPGLLIEMLARLYSRNAAASVDELTDDLLDEIFGTPALPSLDAATARVELSRVLHNNSPMLSRTDLENRLAFLDMTSALALVSQADQPEKKESVVVGP